MIWRLTHRADPRACAIADRHYSRQKIGSPQFVPPGRCLVLIAENDTGCALWVTSWPFPEYTKHEWAGAWVCSLFRNEGAGKASEMIREAIAATRFHFGEPPELGLVTFVNPSEIKLSGARLKKSFIGPIPIYGQTFCQAGFVHVGRTKGGLPAIQMLPERMPPAAPAIGAQFGLAA